MIWHWQRVSLEVFGVDDTHSHTVAALYVYGHARARARGGQSSALPPDRRRLRRLSFGRLDFAGRSLCLCVFVSLAAHTVAALYVYVSSPPTPKTSSLPGEIEAT